MRIPRVFIDQALNVSTQLELPERASHYVTNVLRLRTEDKIIAFNGNGNEYFASISTIQQKKTIISIESLQKSNSESDLRIELGQGVSRGERMDFVFQKAVELGIHSLTPLWTTRCQVHLKGSRLEKRLSHWRGIIHSACEQSGRAVVPCLNSPAQLDEWLPTDSEKLSVVLDPGASFPMCRLPRATEVRVLIGPEGGLSRQEMRCAEASGFIPVRLGPRVLRTETAAIVALAALQTLWGDLGK